MIKTTSSFILIITKDALKLYTHKVKINAKKINKWFNTIMKITFGTPSCFLNEQFVMIRITT